jgi:VanZ family protein
LFKKYISILLVILSILLIIAFTLQPGSASAALAMHFVNVIAKVNNKLNHATADWYSFYILVRKFAHLVEYLVMGAASSFFFLVWIKKHPFLRLRLYNGVN